MVCYSNVLKNIGDKIMRILIATGIYPPDVGGPATWVKFFAEEFTKRGHKMAVVTYSDKPQEDKESWPVYRILRSVPSVLPVLYLSALHSCLAG